MKKEIYPIVGMHCASCKSLIEKTLNSQKGVESAQINYGTEKIALEYDETKISLKEIQTKVSDLGTYKLLAEGHIHHVHKSEELKSLKMDLILTGMLLFPFIILMAWMFLELVMNQPMMENYFLDNYLNILQFILSTPAVFYGGRKIYASALSGLRNLNFNMDTLIMLGTFTAWFYSTIVTFFGENLKFKSNTVYFEAAVFIIFFILLGRYLESRAKSKTNDAIKSLLKLQEKEATVLRDGKEVLLSIEDVKVGDIVIVKPGQKIPVDGKIIEGYSTIDESMISGESIPVEKGVNSKVTGATLNISGYLKIETTKTVENSVLAQIIKMVENAQATEAPIQKLADKVSSIFVPLVLITALVTFIVWLYFQNLSLAIYTATTVLIIACPCALGLATPTAIIVGTGNAAKKGILIKDAKSLEIANKITHIIFDKTGTLTQGKPRVNDLFIDSNSANENDLIKSLIYNLEKKSHHPLAKPIVDYIEDENKKDLHLIDFKDEPGYGITAKHNESTIMIGNQKLLEKYNIALDKKFEDKQNEFNNAGQTISFVILDNQIKAVIAISDKIKTESKSLIEKLNNLNKEIYLLTGDNEKTAKAVANELGIKNIIANVLPNEKAAKVKEIQENNPNNIVAMVGDGINDAPALAQAHIGIAMGDGTDIAIESADIVLVGGSISKVAESIEISKSTLKTIKENLFWAFGYNIIGIPIAAGLLYPVAGILLSPIIASLAMALSSVSVVANSLRLKRAII